MKIVIVGAGEVGFHIASHLAHENKEVVVIDKNAESLRRISDNLDVQVIQGSGSSPVVLEDAGLLNAEVMLAVTDSDEANLVACLVANIISPSTKITNNARPLIAAVVRNEELIIPGGQDRLMPGDLVYIIAEEDKVFDTMAAFDKHDQPIKRALIVGGGNIGYRLAGSLEEMSIYCKIIDKNADRCALLAERLNKTVVLCGDGSDQDLLAEENIQEMDVVITLTRDEETNILTSLLASRMGAAKTITRISKFSYFPLMKAIGIEQVVSPRLSAINTILQHIRRGKVLSAISIKGEQGEVMEALALETSGIVDKPLKKVNFPKGAILVGIVRKDDIIIPTGDSVVKSNDRIIIFAHRKAIPKVEKILAVKLEYF